MLLKPFWGNFFYKDTVTKEISDVLRENPLFTDCSNRELLKLTQIAYPRVYKQDEFVFNQNQLGLGMYIIVSGTVKLSLSGSEKNLKTKDSPYFIPVVLNKGGFFGENALVEEDCIRTLDAMALEETKLVSIFKPDLLDYCSNNREVGLKIVYRIAQILSKRLNKDFELMLELNRKWNKVPTDLK